MPRVPQAENTVRINPLPSARSNVNFTPEAFGAGQARGLAAVGSVVTDYAEKEQQKQDTAALMSAERKLQQWQNQALFAPDTGAFSQRGQNAFNLPDRLLPEWDKQVGEVETGLTARQQQVFRDRAANMRTSMERDLFRHVGGEAEAFQKQETNALVGTRLETAMLYWKDPARFDKELREAQGVFLAGNDQLPPAAQQVGLTEIESKARSTVVTRMIEDSPLEAQRYFDTYRDKMTEADRAAAERILKPARLDAEAEMLVKRAKGEAAAGMPAPADFATYRRRLESGGRADAKNPKSSAYGADQFIESTWINTVKKAKPDWAEGLSREQLLKLRSDPEKSGQMAEALTQENAAALQRAGVETTNETLYAAHHFGADKAIRFAKADVTATAEEMFSRDELNSNPYLKGKTKGEIIMNWQRRAGATESTVASAPKTHAEVLQSLNEIDNPEQRRLAISKYRTQIEIDQLADQERKESFVESINTKVESSAPTANLRQILSPEEYAWAAEEGKLPAWEGRLNQRLAGTEPKTDPNLFDALQTVLARAENGDATAVAEVRKMDVTRLYTSLDRQARDYVQNRRQAVMTSLSKASAQKVPDFASEDQLLNVEVFDKLGISRNPSKDESEEDKNLRLQFMQTYWATTSTKQEELGRKLNSGERQQIMKDLLLPFSREVKDSFFYFDSSETKRGFELGRVPQVDRAQIVSAYRQLYNADPSDAQISAAYLRGQGFAPQLESE